MRMGPVIAVPLRGVVLSTYIPTCLPTYLGLGG